MSILDSIISGGARIVKSEHNTANINWVRGMSDPGEMIACGAYQELRRHANEGDAEYQARIEVILQTLPAEVREKIMAAGRNAAINRAKLDTTNGRVALVTDDAKSWWHGLGHLVEGALDGAQAIQLGGIPTVTKRPYWKPIDGLGDAAEGPTTEPTDRAYYITRDDTGKTIVDYVGPDYQPMQPQEMTDLLDALVRKYRTPRYATAGSLKGGQENWFQLYLPEQSFKLFGGSDVTEAYATFINSHVQGKAGLLFPTRRRVVCDNTKRQATAADSGKGIRLRHDGNMKQRLADAERAMGLAMEGMANMGEEAEALARVSVNATDYFADVLDATVAITNAATAAQVDMGAEGWAAKVLEGAIGITTAQMELEVKKRQKMIDRRENLLESVMARHESGRCEPRGTAYGVFQAVDEDAERGLLNGRFKGDDQGKASRRAESILYGKADDIKQIGYELAMKYVTA